MSFTMAMARGHVSCYHCIRVIIGLIDQDGFPWPGQSRPYAILIMEESVLSNILLPSIYPELIKRVHISSSVYLSWKKRQGVF